jgi:hypothetical protein
MSVVLAWWGVSVVGEQIDTRRDSPFAQEAIDVPPSTSAPATTATTAPPPPAQIDPGSAAAITTFLDTPTSTTSGLLLPETPATTGRPRTTTVPTASPTTAPEASTPDATTTPTSVPPSVPATTPSSTTSPTVSATTAPPPATTTTIPVDRGVTTTTAPTTTTTAGSSTSTSPFPPGWDDRAGFEPKEHGQTTYRFNCGSITVHWDDFEVVNVTGEIDPERRSCVERYRGAQLDITVLDSGETEFVVTYPNGKVDRYVMPAPPPNDD